MLLATREIYIIYFVTMAMVYGFAIFGLVAKHQLDQEDKEKARQRALRKQKRFITHAALQ